jgi:hypothetical protein
MLGIWLANRGQDPGKAEPGDVMLARRVQLAIGFVGGLTLLLSLLAFLTPANLIAFWPWKLTPLTARLVAGMFAVPAAAAIGIFLDARWSSARLLLQAEAVTILLTLIAAALNWDDFNPARPAAWGFVVVLSVALAAIVTLYIAMEGTAAHVPRRPRQASF